MRLTSKGNRSRHAKAGADGVDGWEDERAGGKFWTGWEGSAALGRSRDGRVRMRVEKKNQGLLEAGWLGWTPKEPVSGLRKGHGHVVRASSGEAASSNWYRSTWGTWVHAAPRKQSWAAGCGLLCQPDPAGHQLGGRTCHAPRSLSLRCIALRRLIHHMHLREQKTFPYVVPVGLYGSFPRGSSFVHCIAGQRRPADAYNM